mmetsp:Transcript_16166/g.36975  ORF Transcript_16166/g.36975 Transcript_16166/m.36975 type:complete len:228 (-) Transcript_16166:818-1501(-)
MSIISSRCSRACSRCGSTTTTRCRCRTARTCGVSSISRARRACGAPPPSRRPAGGRRTRSSRIASSPSASSSRACAPSSTPPSCSPRSSPTRTRPTRHSSGGGPRGGRSWRGCTCCTCSMATSAARSSASTSCTTCSSRCSGRSGPCGCSSRRCSSPLAGWPRCRTGWHWRRRSGQKRRRRCLRRRLPAWTCGRSRGLTRSRRGWRKCLTCITSRSSTCCPSSCSSC